MTEEIKNVHREPHPFVGLKHIMGFVGKTIAFVGRVERLDDNSLFLKTSDSKFNPFYTSCFTPLCRQGSQSYQIQE